MPREVIDLDGIADLLGVARVTPPQWRQRSKKGEMNPPLPEPDFPNIDDKPLWYKTTILEWAKRTDRWPAGIVARPTARGPRGPRANVPHKYTQPREAA